MVIGMQLGNRPHRLVDVPRNLQRVGIFRHPALTIRRN
jgi:hypothetical protein